MSFLGGLFSDTKKQETNSTQNASSSFGMTPEIENYWKSISGMYGPGGWQSQDPNQYQSSAAASQAGYAAGLNPAFTAANNIASNGISTADITRFQNPWEQGVVNAAVGDIRDQAAMTGAQSEAAAAKMGALGGTSGISRRLIRDKNLDSTIADTTAKLRSQGFNTAAGLAKDSTGAQLSGLGAASNIAGQQAGINQGQFGMGSTLWGQGWQNAMAPYTLGQMGAQTLAQLTPFSGQSSTGNSTGTSTMTATPSPFSIGMNMLGTAASLYSDERVKENIVQVGETFDGQPIYKYNYKGDPRTTVGLLAQDVEKHTPEAVRSVGGVKTVNYDRALEGADVGRGMADGGSVAPYRGDSDPHERFVKAYDTISGLIQRAKGGSVMKPYAVGGPIGSWDTTVTPAAKGMDWKSMGQGLQKMGQTGQQGGQQDDGSAALRDSQAGLSQFMQTVRPRFDAGGTVDWAETGPSFADAPSGLRAPMFEDVTRSELPPPRMPSETRSPSYVEPESYWGVDENTARSLPLGLRESNNLFNIKYVPGAERNQDRWPGLVGPSSARDQGDPQMRFATPEDSGVAAAKLLRRKYDSGMRTVGDIIAGKMGWTPGRTDSAAAVAKSLGVNLDDDLRLDTEEGMKRFLPALATQEHGGWARDNVFSKKPTLFDDIYARYAGGGTDGGPPRVERAVAGSAATVPATATRAPEREESFLTRILPGLKEGVWAGKEATPIQRFGTALMSVQSPTMAGPMNGFAKNMMEWNQDQLSRRQIDQAADQHAKSLAQARDLALGSINGQPTIAAKTLDETKRLHDADIAHKKAVGDQLKLQTPEYRAQVAEKYGLVPGTSEHQAFVLNGVLPAKPAQGDTIKEVNGKLVRISPQGEAKLIYDTGPDFSKLPEFAMKSAAFASRMVDAEKNIRDLTTAPADQKPKFDPTTGWTGIVNAMPEGLANYTVKEGPHQQYTQAAKQWIRAFLRKESGAAIAPDEFKQDFKTYFPQPGDTADVIKQKEQARLNAVHGFAGETRGFFEHTSPEQAKRLADWRAGKTQADPPADQTYPQANTRDEALSLAAEFKKRNPGKPFLFRDPSGNIREIP